MLTLSLTVRFSNGCVKWTTIKRSCHHFNTPDLTCMSHTVTFQMWSTLWQNKKHHQLILWPLPYIMSNKTAEKKLVIWKCCYKTMRMDAWQFSSIHHWAIEQRTHTQCSFLILFSSVSCSPIQSSWNHRPQESQPIYKIKTNTSSNNFWHLLYEEQLYVTLFQDPVTYVCVCLLQYGFT